MIYFIGCEAAGAVKIGVTSNRIYERLNQAQVNCPLELKLLAAVDGGLSGERELHARFAHLRIRGEWFQAAPELMEHISALPCPAKPPHGWWSQKRNREIAA